MQAAWLSNFRVSAIDILQYWVDCADKTLELHDSAPADITQAWHHNTSMCKEAAPQRLAPGMAQEVRGRPNKVRCAQRVDEAAPALAGEAPDRVLVQVLQPCLLYVSTVHAVSRFQVEVEKHNNAEKNILLAGIPPQETQYCMLPASQLSLVLYCVNYCYPRQYRN